jgi:hypothetical protein
VTAAGLLGRKTETARWLLKAVGMLEGEELWSQEDMDEELTYIKREIARLELKLRQDKKMVQVCEPETGESLNDLENELGSAEDLKHCQEGREGFQISR